MFKKILIANRGEIALRIIRTCQEMGLETVAVYSEADRDSLHVLYADEAVCVGPAESTKSYLNIQNIISAAEISGADAIHPGYGFLAENSHFAEVCQDCRIKFIGPSAAVIQKMGDKIVARETIKKAGVPVIPGSEGAVSGEKEALKVAEKIGYPIIIKAAAGGGGKGMRVVHEPDELNRAFHLAQGEARAAFNNDQVYLEKYLSEPHHIEFQILADERGNLVHLGERDCSIQRRHQKLVEESPSPFLSEKLRHRMGQAAVKAAKAVGYTNAGTIEFLVDGEENFYFMEMNTRLQVEHGVTEVVTGIDLVKEQILIAAGEKIDLTQKDVRLNGHAIECRINAEDSFNDFRPCPGKVTAYNPPGGPGVRLDSHVHNEYVIPLYYDSLLAKLIVHHRDRTQAINRMQRSLKEYVIEGLPTTIPFHQKVMANEQFRKGNFNTHFLDYLEPD